MGKQRRQWDAKSKAMIVMEGMKGKSVSEICIEHGIAQAQYYQWRDLFLKNASKAFENGHDQKEQKLERENERLKALVGELTLELKKTEEWLS